jgi:hypothetical protein
LTPVRLAALVLLHLDQHLAHAALGYDLDAAGGGADGEQFRRQHAGV